MAVKQVNNLMQGGWRRRCRFMPVEELPDSHLAGATWLARLPHETASGGATLATAS